MRISSNQIHQVAVNSMLEQELKLSNIQKQVATGERISSASDDPVAAARLVDLQQAVDNFEQYQSSINAGRSRLDIEESALESVVTVLHRVRELTLQANNAIQTNETRAIIGEEINQLNNEVKGLANSIDSNDDFLFSGSKVKYQPFTALSNGNLRYNGDEGQRMLQIGPNRQISIGDSGTEVFRKIRNGNGDFSITSHPRNKGSAVADPGTGNSQYHPDYYLIQFIGFKDSPELSYRVLNKNGEMIVPIGNRYSELAAIEFQGVITSFKGKPEHGDSFLFSASRNQDIFSTLSSLESVLKTARHGSAEKINLANKLNQSLVSIDQALGNVLKIRSNIGSRLRAIDNQENINESHLIHLKEIQSEIKDLDYTEAVTRLNQRLTGLEASQKAYVKVQNLTMFDYI